MRLAFDAVFDQRRTDGERASARVEVAAAQCGELAVAQAREGREKDQGAKARRDLAGEVQVRQGRSLLGGSTAYGFGRRRCVVVDL